MADRYNIYDWVGDRSQQRLKQLLSKYDIKVDENKQNKQQVLSQVLNTLQTAEEVFELKKIFLTPDPLDKNFIESQNEEKKLIESQCNLAIKRKHIQRSIEEAVSTYVIAEELKKLNDIVKELDKKIAEEKDQILKAIYQASADQVQQQLRDNLARLQKQAMSDMLQHKQNIDRLDKEIAALRDKKEAIFTNGAIEAISNQKQQILPSGKYLNDYMTDSQAIKIQEELAREMYKNEKERLKKIESNNDKIADLKDQISELQKQQTQNGRPQSNAFMPSFTGAQKSGGAKTDFAIAQLQKQVKDLEHENKVLSNPNSKVVEQQNLSSFNSIAAKHGVDVNQIPPEDNEVIAKNMINAGHEMVKEAVLVREEKNELKVEIQFELDEARKDYEAFNNQKAEIQELQTDIIQEAPSDIQSEMDDFFATFDFPDDGNNLESTNLKNR